MQLSTERGILMKNAKLFAIVSLSSLATAGCYVVPVVGRDGAVEYYAYPPGVPPPALAGGVPVAIPAPPPGPIELSARLYPDNDTATQTGVVSGTVTNMMNGKGRFQLEYRGEILTGEATSVDGNARRGVASAVGSGGGYMSCEYQLANARQGAGTCTFSSGARYRLHLGS
jgi:hypothetical protein